MREFTEHLVWAFAQDSGWKQQNAAGSGGSARRINYRDVGCPGISDNKMQMVLGWPTTRNWSIGEPWLVPDNSNYVCSLLFSSIYTSASFFLRKPALYLDPMYGRQCLPTDSKTAFPLLSPPLSLPLLFPFLLTFPLLNFSIEWRESSLAQLKSTLNLLLYHWLEINDRTVSARILPYSLAGKAI